jgi:protein required for attachment to host cells
MIKARKCWFVVAGATRAAAYRRRADRPGYDEVASWEAPEAGKPARELVTDRPGRAFDSRGGQRHAMEPHEDPKDAARRAFAGTLAAALGAAQDAGRFEALVLFAPPRMLGMLRNDLPANGAAAVARAIAKDLTRLPALELYAAFDAALAPP